ncbi:hypothetical protein CDL12_28793 [Handroanthus impetiginosus]|uniref:NAC domain-containing protein n=1 Tax=Handroanthus impetiginosus TaxID=429701 RepID=A0A2G9G070_9LAMI|nr:hypothetical protein CDL12_28793 [Handroanthus impetiginosus]
MEKNYQYERNESHLPPGFRFHPTDEELITYYLFKKVLDCGFTSRAIAEADLNKCEPWHLPGKAKMGENEWYFFSLRDRKYPTGLRTNRATEAGYWKATGKDREIYSSKSCSLVGMKKTLVFYRGRAPKGEKSNWVMHEYRLEGKLAYHYLSRNSEEEWVISRVFQKPGSSTSAAAGGGARKRPPSGGTTITNISDVSSPSSVSLSPLVELSSAGAAKEHVPCFSTTAAASFNLNSLFDLPPPPRPSSMAALILDPISPLSSAFPENYFRPSVISAVHGGTDDEMFSYAGSLMSQWPAPENEKLCTNELDCMWSC